MDTQKSDDDMTISQKIGSLEESKKKRFSLTGNKARSHVLRDLKEELKKVSWTSKQELTLCTKIVLGSTIFFGFSIYMMDVVIRMTLNGMGSLVRYFAG